MTVHTRARAMAAALDEFDEGGVPLDGSSPNTDAAADPPSSFIAAPAHPRAVEPRADAIRPASAGADADTASHGVRPENAWCIECGVSTRCRRCREREA